MVKTYSHLTISQLAKLSSQQFIVHALHKHDKSQSPEVKRTTSSVNISAPSHLQKAWENRASSITQKVNKLILSDPHYFAVEDKSQDVSFLRPLLLYSCTFINCLKTIQGHVKSSAFHTYLIFPNYNSLQWQADWNSYDPCCSCFAGFLYLHKHFLFCFLILPWCPIMASYHRFFTISSTWVQIVFQWWQLCLWYFLL